MTLVLGNTGSTESIELAWSEKAVKHLVSMGAIPLTANTTTTSTKLFFEVADPHAAEIELRRVGAI